MEKYVIIGSAPHMKEYWPKVREYYIINDYKICAINNAWSLEREHLHKLYLPNDFLEGAGTLIPSKVELNKLPIEFMPVKVDGYLDNTGGTMSINVMHILLNNAIKQEKEIKVVVIGNDYIYEKGSDTHFYGTSTPTEIVTNKLKENNPKYVGLAADPLRYGNKWLMLELDHVKSRYSSNNCSLLTDTPFPKKTLLPFDKINRNHGAIIKD